MSPHKYHTKLALAEAGSERRDSSLSEPHKPPDASHAHANFQCLIRQDIDTEFPMWFSLVSNVSSKG